MPIYDQALADAYRAGRSAVLRLYAQRLGIVAYNEALRSQATAYATQDERDAFMAGARGDLARWIKRNQAR